MTRIANGQLKSLIERIERLTEEKRTIGGDISEVFAEAKGQGFDTKIMRQVLKLRAMDPAQRDEQSALLDLYMNALAAPAPQVVGFAQAAE